MVLVWDESSLARQCCKYSTTRIELQTLLKSQRRQMCGRAGRKGKDETGETYLICGKPDLQAVCDLLEADMPAIESCLAREKRGLKR
jgi:replicative superfamily II helicase